MIRRRDAVYLVDENGVPLPTAMVDGEPRLIVDDVDGVIFPSP